MWQENISCKIRGAGGISGQGNCGGGDLERFALTVLVAFCLQGIHAFLWQLELAVMPTKLHLMMLLAEQSTCYTDSNTSPTCLQKLWVAGDGNGVFLVRMG